MEIWGEEKISSRRTSKEKVVYDVLTNHLKLIRTSLSRYQEDPLKTKN
jgi:uncharacterized membrane protein